MKKFSAVLELESKSQCGCHDVKTPLSKSEVQVVAANENSAKEMLMDYFGNRIPDRQPPALKYEGELPDGTPAGLTIRPIE